MKKVILEEVDRIREIMGFNSLITEGIGDEAATMIGELFSKAEGEDLINNFIKSAKKADGSMYLDDAGKQIETWPELAQYARVAGSKVDEVIPGFTDDLFEYFLKGSGPENAKMFKKAAVESYFPEGMIKNYNSWKQGLLTKDASEALKKDMVALADGIQNRYIKEAVEETNMMRQMRGVESRGIERTAGKSNAQINSEFQALRQNSLKKDYKYNEADWQLLEDAKIRGIITPAEYKKLGNMQLPSFGQLWDLYESYRVAKKAGESKAISFEEYLVEQLKYKLPGKFTKTGVTTLKTIATPIEAIFGRTKVMSWQKAIGILFGLTATGTVGFKIINDLGEASKGALENVGGLTGDLNYSANYQTRWKEYWSSENSPKKKIGGIEESIYSPPDESNTQYSDVPPEIKLIDADEKIVKILGGNKISLGGKEYDTVYFKLAQTVAGYGEGKLNPDVIEPFESSKTSTQQQQTTTVSPITNDEKAKVVEELKAMDPNGDYGTADYDYIKKIDNNTFEYEDVQGNKIEVKI